EIYFSLRSRSQAHPSWLLGFSNGLVIRYPSLFHVHKLVQIQNNVGEIPQRRSRGSFLPSGLSGRTRRLLGKKRKVHLPFTICGRAAESDPIHFIDLLARVRASGVPYTVGEKTGLHQHELVVKQRQGLRRNRADRAMFGSDVQIRLVEDLEQRIFQSAL